MNEIKANASGLTKGEYVFQVEIEDDAMLTAKATVNVTVMQSNKLEFWSIHFFKNPWYFSLKMKF